MAREMAAALSQLASCNLKELHLKRADGSRILDSLHATCRAANVIPASTPDATPKERYLAVFDAALAGGLGCWILDYVEVVCADRHLTSNDPLEAYLLDGGFVKAWASACLARAEQAATSALTADMAFHSFHSSGQLQGQLAQTRVLVAVLRALDRIRTGAAGGAVAGVSGASSGGAAGDRLSVKEELRQAVLLEQAFQVMDWCARQGLAEPRAAATGRFGSYPEWSRAVNARRARAAPRPLFLDSLLQSLSLSGAYPASSVQHMLHTLLLVVRDPEPAAWAAKLALLSYFLLDAGVLEASSGAGGGAVAAGQGGGVGAGAGSAGGEARVEVALEELRRTFRLSAADVGVWQCNYLLDCAVPDGPDGSEDPYLARACALLPSCVTPALPFAFIEALLALGRPGVALAVDRGQSGSEAVGSGSAAAAGGAASGSGRPCRTLAQATTLLDTRLRCGLMTEAFMLLRQHVSDLAARLHAAGGSSSGSTGGGRAELEEHTRVLLGRLAEWAAAQDEAGAAAAVAAAGGSSATLAAAASTGWLNRLTELPLNATEESVLVSWLVGEAEAGRPAGDFLPLFFLQRGRVNEATAAWRRWDARQAALAAAGRRRSPVTDLVAAALDAAHCGGLPGPLRNVMVPAPAPGAEQPAAAGVSGLTVLAPGQGAVGILAGLLDHMSPDQPLAVLPFHGAEPPPLVSRAVQLPAPHITAAQQAAVASRGGGAGAGAPTAPGSAQPQGQSQQPFVGMPLQLPAAAPFRAPPPTPGPDAFGASGHQGGFFRPAPGGTGTLGVSGGGAGVGGGSGAGGAGGLLFSVGAGAVAAAPAPGGGVGPAGLGGLAAARSTKRYKPNDWF